MEYVRFTGLECHYGAREIFSGASGVLATGDRVGLVGSNGAGKSSMLRLLAGVDQPFGGTIARAREMRMGYLSQNVADESEATLAQLIERALTNAPPDQAGLRAKSLRIMLDAFGFSAEDVERPLRSFSGGQRAKAAFAHVLIDEPDYLILDEPTNHLDVATIRWLETTIANDRRPYLIVSHDRYFLDRVATRIWELDRGALQAYPPASPAYSAFVAAREVRREEQRRAYDTYVAERDKRRATVAGLRATLTSSNYSRVRSREKQLDTLESSEVAPPPPPPPPIAVRLSAARRGRGFAFEVSGLAKAYDRPLFTGLTMAVDQGERLAVVGPNGSGKSTLLKILAGEMQAETGAIRFNPAASIAYFAQSSHEQLDPDATAVDAVRGAGVDDERARSLLGRMRISGTAADKPVRVFSGGERRRIMLARLMAQRADVLLMDEPTNDLDIESREALESVLGEYDGTLVMISHDRYFLASLAERVLWIEDGSWGVVDGGYDAYETEQRERLRDSRASAAAQPREKTSKETPLKVKSRLQTRIAKMERDIASIDTRRAEIDALFADAALYEDRARVKTLEAERATLEERSAAALSEWEALVNELEAL